jgi:uncharacterized protein (DUF849 family)
MAAKVWIEAAINGPWDASQSNRELVEEAVAIIRKAGVEPASASRRASNRQARRKLEMR